MWNRVKIPYLSKKIFEKWMKTFAKNPFYKNMPLAVEVSKEKIFARLRNA